MWLVAQDGLLEGAVPLWSHHWAIDGWRTCCDGSSTFCLFAFLVSSWEIDGKAERRWLGTSPCDNERTNAFRKNALRAYEGKSSELIPPGPRSRVGTIQLNWVSSAYWPNVTNLLFGGRKALCCCCLLYTSPSPRDQRGSRMPSSA